jgi:nitroimidazol reductase NimA-like FMN-containing flavoprotein (pyridoxamine 5'-phosphate oxidase superfamily)
MDSPVPDAVERRLTAAPRAAYLATSQDDRPHVAPLWYRYEAGTIELTTTGRKLENLRENPRVALAVQAAEAGIPRWTVTVRGTASVVEDAAEEARIRRAINEKYGVDPEEYAENVAVRVDVGSTSYTEY